MSTYTNPSIDQEISPKQIFYVDNKCAIFTCNGSPDGVILANTGSIAISDNGIIYKKTTDDVNTGWIELTALSSTVKNLVNNATPVGNIGAGTDNLMSFSVNGGSLKTDNDCLRIKICGNASAQDGGAGDQRTFSWSYGGQAIDSRQIAGTNAPCSWEVYIEITRISPTTARYNSSWFSYNNTTAAALNTVFNKQGTIAVTHANANVFQVTGASTDAVDNDCTQNLLQIDLVQQ